MRDTCRMRDTCEMSGMCGPTMDLHWMVNWIYTNAGHRTNIKATLHLSLKELHWVWAGFTLETDIHRGDTLEPQWWICSHSGSELTYKWTIPMIIFYSIEKACVSLFRYKTLWRGQKGVVVVVCGKICGCGNICGKIEKFKHCQIETKKIVVVDIDSPIMVVVCGSSLW